jgi:excisionase family DNA binding protein
MGLICEGIMLVTGIFMLITGRFNMGQVKAKGDNVRLAGGILLLPLICGFLLGLSIAGQVQARTFFGSNLFWTVTIIEYLMIIGAALISGTIVYNARNTDVTSESGSLPTATPNVLTLREAAVYLRVSEEQVNELINSGQLPAVKVGYDYRIARQAIDDFVMRR